MNGTVKSIGGGKANYIQETKAGSLSVSANSTSTLTLSFRGDVFAIQSLTATPQSGGRPYVSSVKISGNTVKVNLQNVSASNSYSSSVAVTVLIQE